MKKNKFVDDYSRELIDSKWMEREFEVGIFSSSGTAKTPRQTLKTFKTWNRNIESYMAEDVKWTKKELFDSVGPNDIIRVFDKETGRQVLEIPKYDFVGKDKLGDVTVEWDRSLGVVNFVRTIL